MKYSKTKLAIGLLSVVAIGLLFSRRGEAGGGSRVSCKVTTVPDKVLFGDEFYGRDNWNWCRSEWLDSMNDGFGIDREEWGGQGFNDPCNSDLPLGRLHAGIVALQTASPDRAPDTKNRDGSILRWGFGFVWQTVDNLDVKCSTEHVLAACHCWGIPLLGQHYIELLAPAYFYKQFVVERSVTLLHEARHWNGKGHDADDGKDSSWAYNGAWRWEIAWLSHFAAEATDAPMTQRCKAQDLANVELPVFFVQDPGFLVDVIDCSGGPR